MDRRVFLSLGAGGAAFGAALTNPFTKTALASSIKPDIKAIVFDGFPIFDPRPILKLSATLFPEHGLDFGRAWFSKIFAYTWLRTNGHRYKGFYNVIGEALDFTVTSLKVQINPRQREQLMAIWLNLQVWPDVIHALQSLKERNIRLGFLSNFSEEMLRVNCKNSGIENAFEVFLSTDRVSAYKPDPRAYQMGVDAFELPKENIAFAAFAAWDAVGASWFGYPTVWVNRLNFPAENLDAGHITTGRNISTLVDFSNQ